MVKLSNALFLPLTRVYTYGILLVAMAIFTRSRRDWLAVTFRNLILLIVAAAFASKFFVEFTTRIKISIIAGLIVLFILGFWLCPGEKGE